MQALIFEIRIQVLIFSVPEYVYFLAAGILGGWMLIEFLIWRVKVLAHRKKLMLQMQYEYAKLEDKALRTQMNPHFIFNSMNSIKLLVQENKNEQAISYLTTFTRLLRNLLMYADKTKATLAEELETCRLYLALESLRFNDGFTYHIDIEPKDLDLKALEVPFMILQPFVENAIWHGLMHKPADRNLQIKISQVNDWISCKVDDNGIGREAAGKKQRSDPHESKGMAMTAHRLRLNDQLNHTQTNITIKDKVDASGNPAGTCVEILFSLND